MKLDVSQWQITLAKLIADVFAEFRASVDDEMEMFVVDCHPWNGGIYLAFLTSSELRDSPFLSEIAEMASWRYYAFDRDFIDLTSSPALAEHAFTMRTPYEEADDPHEVANQYLSACAAALASKTVQDTLATFRRTTGFKISVPHPDSGEEFFPPQ